MLKLQSQTITVPLSPQDLYQRITDLPRLKGLMPDSVERFEADAQSFLFGIKGLPDVRLLWDQEASEAPHKVTFKSASSKLDFFLWGQITAAGEGQSQLHFDFEGDFNPMLKMMAQRPLKSFIEDLAQKAGELKPGA